MTTLLPETEHNWLEAGCARDCRDGHTYRWWRCAYAVKPEPTLLRSDLVTQPDDGYPSLAFTTLNVSEVADWLRERGYTVTPPEEVR